MVEVRKKKLVQSWRAASPCPRDPTTAGNSDFPSALTTSFKRHLNIGDTWRYCQNYTSHSSNSWATFPTLVFKGEKTEQFILSLKLLKFRTNHPRADLRVIWNMIFRNERTFSVDPSPRDAGTRPLVAELLCSRNFNTCLAMYLFSFTMR